MQLPVDLHYTIFWAAVVIFSIASALLSYALLRFRHRSASDAPDQSFRGNAVLEMIWTFIPVGILVVLLVLTFQQM